MSQKILERMYPVLAFAPVDLNDGAITGDYVNLRDWERMVFLLLMADGTAGSDVDLAVYQATSSAGADAKVCNCLETGRIYRQSAATYAAYAALTGSWEKITQAIADEQYAPTDNGEEVGIIALEIRAGDLDVENGFDYVRVDVTDPGAAKIAAGLYLMADPRYSAAPELMKNPMV